MGTPNLTGTFTGTTRILVRASSTPDHFGKTAAATLCNVAWSWEFNGICEPCGTLTIANGNLFPSAIAPLQTCVPYEITAIGGGTSIPVIDNGDGTYTIRYHWKITPPGGGDPIEADTLTRLEITHLRQCGTPPSSFQNIVITTVEDFWRGVPGTPLPTPPFFLNATLAFDGCASPT